MADSRGRSRPTISERRRVRERSIVLATRELFDHRGMRDAPVHEIAREAGMNKALIYRSFDSKEEVFVLTLVDYLAELQARMLGLSEPEDPLGALRMRFECYVDFCLEYPAFLDCALALMQRPAPELRKHVSDAVWLRLGRSMSACIAPLQRILAAGVEQGIFELEDPAFTANRLYTQVLGSLHLARVGVGLARAAPGVPQSFEISRERMREACVQDALAVARIRPGAGS